MGSGLSSAATLPGPPGNPGVTFPLDCGAGCRDGRQGFRGQRGASQSLLSLPLPSGRQDSCTVILQKGQPRGKTSPWAYAFPGPCGRGGGWDKLFSPDSCYDLRSLSRGPLRPPVLLPLSETVWPGTVTTKSRLALSAGSVSFSLTYDWLHHMLQKIKKRKEEQLTNV